MKKLDIGLILAFGLLFIGLGVTFIPWNYFHGRTIFNFILDTKDYNELGDFVGGITAPFLSVAAFILLYMTYKSQKQELIESRKILRKQSETLEKQQFETTFFNLLNLHHEIVNNIDLVKGTGWVTYKKMGETEPTATELGRDCFKTFYKMFVDTYKHTPKDESYLTMISKSYDKFYKLYQSDLGHYFRNLYHIFKLIKRSDILNKKDYSSLVRAQLSSHELLMLFYNGLSDNGEKFKPLIEEFHILKNMPFDDLILEQHKGLYQSSAFGTE
jgi:hypothetical protein